MRMMSEASNEKSWASQYSKQRRGMQVNVLLSCSVHTSKKAGDSWKEKRE
jgi:hypothetical protein